MKSCTLTDLPRALPWRSAPLAISSWCLAARIRTIFNSLPQWSRYLITNLHPRRAYRAQVWAWSWAASSICGVLLDTQVHAKLVLSSPKFVFTAVNNVEKLDGVQSALYTCIRSCSSLHHVPENVFRNEYFSSLLHVAHNLGSIQDLWKSLGSNSKFLNELKVPPPCY